jgi:hypothetical protein
VVFTINFLGTPGIFCPYAKVRFAKFDGYKGKNFVLSLKNETLDSIPEKKIWRAGGPKNFPKNVGI